MITAEDAKVQATKPPDGILASAEQEFGIPEAESNGVAVNKEIVVLPMQIISIPIGSTQRNCLRLALDRDNRLKHTCRTLTLRLKTFLRQDTISTVAAVDNKPLQLSWPRKHRS